MYEKEGMNFFLYNAKSTTKGITEIYFCDGTLYPLVTVSESNEKAKLFIDNNISQIGLKVATMSSNEFITREEFVKKLSDDTVIDKPKVYYPTVDELQIEHNKIKAECDVGI